jgi:hypothetical protein
LSITACRCLLDGVEVVEEYDAVGNWQARYVYEDGIDHPRCMDRADIADVNGNQNTTEVLRFHYHQQVLGSVTEVTQPTGAVVEWVTYDVYGQPSIRDQLGNGIAQSAIGRASGASPRRRTRTGRAPPTPGTASPGSRRSITNSPRRRPSTSSSTPTTRSTMHRALSPVAGEKSGACEGVGSPAMGERAG